MSLQSFDGLNFTRKNDKNYATISYFKKKRRKYSGGIAYDKLNIS